jgi:signal transduction histidine kinase
MAEPTSGAPDGGGAAHGGHTMDGVREPRRPNPWSSEEWARRLSPQSYAGKPKAAILAGGCVLAMALLLLQDLYLYTGYSSLPLSLIFVAAAGWFLGRRALSVVAAAAVIVHLVETSLSHWGWFVALIGVAGVVLVAVTARLLATGRERDRLVGEQQRRLGELTFLFETAEQLAGTLDEDRILQSVVGAAARAVSRTADGRPGRAAYHEVRGDTLVIRVDSQEQGTVGFEYPVDRNEGAKTALATGAATAVRPDVLTGSVQDLALRLDVKVVLMAPVRVGEERVVGLLVASHTDHDGVQREELRLLEVLARLAGLAIGNAEHLRQEQKHVERIEALEKTKSQLLNVASHELRGPLTVARGYVSMLADGNLGDLPEKPSEVVPIVASKLTEMEMLVDQMLEASRLEEERMLLRRQRTDLRKLANEAVVVLRPLLSDGRRMVLDLPDQEVPVTVDPVRVVTILNNLLTNALKYSPGGGDIRCKVSCTDERVRVSVRDRGLGISPENLDRLFTRFGRVVTSENANISGAGLGLFISRELAREHDGDITVISALGKGSEFTLELPRSS